MLTIDRYDSTGLLLATYRLEIITADYDCQIDRADEFNVEMASGACLSADDEIDCYDDDGEKIGRFIVVGPEWAHDSAGSRIHRFRAVPLATDRLQATAIPSSDYLKGVTWDLLIGKLNYLENAQGGLATTFSQNGTPTSVRDAMHIETLENALASLTEIGNITGAHWRSRPDVDGQFVEYGTFGQELTIYLESAYGASDYAPREATGVYTVQESSFYRALDDCVTCVIVSAGGWKDLEGKQKTLNLDDELFIMPPGYSRIKFHGEDGTDYSLICKDAPGQRRRTRRILFSGITPVLSSDRVPNDLEITEARSALWVGTKEYLDINAPGKQTWTVTIPSAMTGLGRVGDKIWVDLVDEDCGATYTGWLFISVRKTSWKSEASTEFELCTVLESLRDPTAKEYSPKAVADAGGVTQSNTKCPAFTVSVPVGGGTGSYTFAAPYSVAPRVTANPATAGCVWGIGTVTAAGFTVTSTGPCTAVVATVAPLC